MRIRPILLVVGTVLLGLALLMLVPGIVAAVLVEGSRDAFFQSAGLTAGAGAILVAVSAHSRVLIYPKQTFVITTMAWVGVSLFGALPFIIYSDINYTDAVFETMSGITTTGSTVLVGLDTMPRSVLLWRSMLNWIGGLGFAVMAIAILPFLGVGGMRLFRSESSEWTDKATPRMRSLALLIASTYGTLSIACAGVYFAFGMSAFDAINHSMSTIATGGFSTHDASFIYFANPMLEWSSALFMILGALPFVLYVKALQDHGRSLVTDQQVRGFLSLIVVLVTVIGIWHHVHSTDGLSDSMRAATFNVVSVITTTGYVSADYGSWGQFPTMAFFYLMFIGGCSGSTAGAFKIFRLQLAIEVLRNQVQRQIHPHGVFRLEYNRRPIGDDIVRSLIGFSLVFFVTIAVLAFALSAFDLDPVTSLSASVTAVTNVGPGLGPIVGPVGNFASLPDPAKWLLTAGMLLGRLEIMTVVVLFSRRFWSS